MPSFLLTHGPGDSRGDYFFQSEIKDEHGKAVVLQGTRASLTPCADGTPNAITGTDAKAVEAAHGLVFHPCPAEVPASITPSQMRRQLLADGITEDHVKAVTDQIPDAKLKADALIMFDYELEFLRGQPLLIQLAGALGYNTPAKLDAFFISAAKL